MRIKNVVMVVLLLTAAAPLFSQDIITAENGMLLIRVTATPSSDGQTFMIQLYRDWSESRTGMSARAKTWVSFYVKTGHLHYLELAKDWPLPGTNLIAQRGKNIYFHDNGDIFIFTAATDWSHPDFRFTIKAGTSVVFYEKMRFKGVTLKEDLPLGNNFIAAQGAWLYFHENGSIHTFTQAQGFTGESGFVFVPGMIVEMDDKGKITHIWYTPEENTPYGQGGPILKKGELVGWDGNGRLVSATFAENWTDPVTKKKYKKDVKHSF